VTLSSAILLKKPRLNLNMEGWTILGLLVGLFLLCSSLFSLSLLLRQVKTLRYIYLTASLVPPRLDSSYVQETSFTYTEALKRIMPVYGLANYQSVQFDLPPAAHLLLYALHLSLLWTLNLATSGKAFAPQFAVLAAFLSTSSAVAFSVYFGKVYVGSYNQKVDRGSPSRGHSKVRSFTPAGSRNLSPVKISSPAKSLNSSPNKSRSPIKSARLYNEMLKKLGRSPTKHPAGPSSVCFPSMMRCGPENIDGTTTYEEKSSSIAVNPIQPPRIQKSTLSLEIMLGTCLFILSVSCFWTMATASTGDPAAHFSCFLQWLLGVALDYPIRFAAGAVMRRCWQPYEEQYVVQNFFLCPQDLPLYVKRKPEMAQEPSHVSVGEKPALFHISEESNSPLSNHFPYYPTPVNSSLNSSRFDNRLLRRYEDILQQFESSEPDHEEFSIIQLMPVSSSSPRGPIYHPEMSEDVKEMNLSPTKFCRAVVTTSLYMNESPSPQRPVLGRIESMPTEESNVEEEEYQSEEAETELDQTDDTPPELLRSEEADETEGREDSYKEEELDEVDPRSLTPLFYRPCTPEDLSPYEPEVRETPLEESLSYEPRETVSHLQDDFQARIDEAVLTKTDSYQDDFEAESDPSSYPGTNLTSLKSLCPPSEDNPEDVEVISPPICSLVPPDEASRVSKVESFSVLSAASPEPCTESQSAFELVTGDCKQSRNQSDAVLEDLEECKQAEVLDSNPIARSCSQDYFRVFAEQNHQTFEAEDTLPEPQHEHFVETAKENKTASRARRPPTGKRNREEPSSIGGLPVIVQDLRLEADRRLRHKSMLNRASPQAVSDAQRSESLQPRRRSRKLDAEDLLREIEANKQGKIGLTSKNFKRRKTRQEMKQNVDEILALQARALDSENESTFHKLRQLLEAKQAFKKKHLPVRESSPYTESLMRKNSREDSLTPNLVYLDEEYKRKQEEKLKSVSSIYNTSSRGRRSKRDL
jgi:hypothetical protein